MSQKITPFLWFEKGAEDAAKYYVSIFKDSKITDTTHYSKEGAQASGQKEGSVMTVAFELEGQKFTALNGGSAFKMGGAISFVVNCKDQAEVDYFWEKLGDGGETGDCGWIMHDKFGVTWQITPTILPEYLSDPDKEKANRVMAAMLTMKKLDVAILEKAYKGK